MDYASQFYYFFQSLKFEQLPKVQDELSQIQLIMNLCILLLVLKIQMFALESLAIPFFFNATRLFNLSISKQTLHENQLNR